MRPTIAGFLQIASIASAFAALGPTPADAGTLDKLRQDKQIRLAIRADAPPFSFMGATGEPADSSSTFAGPWQETLRPSSICQN